MSLNSLPGRKAGDLEAGILIDAPVLGFLPVRAARFVTLNVPKPTRRTSLPFLSSFWMLLTTESRALVASDLLRLVSEAIALTRSDLFMVVPFL
jgi:hypothetical protein